MRVHSAWPYGETDTLRSMARSCVLVLRPSRPAPASAGRAGPRRESERRASPRVRRPRLLIESYDTIVYVAYTRGPYRLSRSPLAARASRAPGSPFSTGYRARFRAPVPRAELPLPLPSRGHARPTPGAAAHRSICTASTLHTLREVWTFRSARTVSVGRVLQMINEPPR